MATFQDGVAAINAAWNPTLAATASFTTVSSGHWFGIQFQQGTTVILAHDSAFDGSLTAPTIAQVMASFGGNSHGAVTQLRQPIIYAVTNVPKLVTYATNFWNATRTLIPHCLDYAGLTGSNGQNTQTTFGGISFPINLYAAAAVGTSAAYLMTHWIIATLQCSGYAGQGYDAYCFTSGVSVFSQPAAVTINNRKYTAVDQVVDMSASPGQLTTGLDLSGVICDSANPSSIFVESEPVDGWSTAPDIEIDNEDNSSIFCLLGRVLITPGDR